MWKSIGLVLLLGCNGQEGESEKKAEDEEDGCGNSIVEVFPADGAGDAFYRTSIEFQLAAADDTATLVVEGPDGAISGATSWEDTRLIFTPDEPLAPSTSYTATLSYCVGDAGVSWSTSATGAPADVAQGDVYALDLASGRFVEPAGVGPLIQQQLTTEILIAIGSVGADSLELLGALGLEGSNPPEQDRCVETIAFPEPADFSEDPFFSVGPDTTTLAVSGFEVTISDLVISGAITPDGERIEGGVLAGEIDTAPLAPLIGDDTEPEEVCELVATFGVGCIECSDGTSELCLRVRVDSLTADRIPGAIEARTAADIDADTSCD